MANASWNDCSISGDQTPSASFAMSTGLLALPSSAELVISSFDSWSEILAVLMKNHLKLNLFTLMWAGDLALTQI